MHRPRPGGERRPWQRDPAVRPLRSSRRADRRDGRPILRRDGRRSRDGRGIQRGRGPRARRSPAVCPGGRAAATRLDHHAARDRCRDRCGRQHDRCRRGPVEPGRGRLGLGCADSVADAHRRRLDAGRHIPLAGEPDRGPGWPLRLRGDRAIGRAERGMVVANPRMDDRPPTRRSGQAAGAASRAPAKRGMRRADAVPRRRPARPNLHEPVQRHVCSSSNPIGWGIAR